MAKKKTISSPSLFEQEAPPAPTSQLADKPDLPDLSASSTIPTIPVKEPKPNVEPAQCVKLRDGEILNIGDEVTINDSVLPGIVKHPFEGKTYIIEKMTEWPRCESGMLVIARQKDNPELKTTGIGGKGIDANWFKKTN